MEKKIGIITGGGDCPGLNTVIRAVAKAATMRGWEALGILGGMAIAAAPPLNIPATLYWAEMQTIVDLSDINTGVIKAASFGLLIGLAACWRGLQAERSAAGAGQAATAAVVTSTLLIIVADSIFAVAFNILGW